MLSKNDSDKPLTKEEAPGPPTRPPPEKYDPDRLSHWSITMTLAWIVWRDLDAVRDERDDYRKECADWVFKRDPRAQALDGRIALDNFADALNESMTGEIVKSDPVLQEKIQDRRKDLKKNGSWHYRQCPPSSWGRLSLRAISEAVLEPRQQAIPSPQDAVDELRRAAGDDRIKATALERGGDRIGILADYWPHLKLTDDPSTGKAMLIDDNGRVYRDVWFRQSDVKELWPPLSVEVIEPDTVEVLPEPERVETPDPTSPAEPEFLSPAAWFDDARRDHPRLKNEPLIVYADRLHALMKEAHREKRVTKLWARDSLLRRFYVK